MSWLLTLPTPEVAVHWLASALTSVYYGTTISTFNRYGSATKRSRGPGSVDSEEDKRYDGDHIKFTLADKSVVCALQTCLIAQPERASER